MSEYLAPQRSPRAGYISTAPRTTEAPCEARFSKNALPMPQPTPVTIANLSFSTFRLVLPSPGFVKHFFLEIEATLLSPIHRSFLIPPLIRATNCVFWPVDVKFGPDGAPIICHYYEASFRHPERDKTHGRIWRLTARGRPLTAPPNLAFGQNKL